MRYVVIYEDDQGKRHIHHVEADSQQAAYDVVADAYDAKHGEGAFFPLTVGVGIAADIDFREQYEQRLGVKKPMPDEE
jgi:hypothetical protein